MKLLLKIAFLGTNYCGYQVQKTEITVQKVLNDVALRIFGFDCDVVGCSRTDSGVHANDFRVTISKKGCLDLQHNIPLDKIPIAFNSCLPDDISVLNAKMVENGFHPRYDVRYKEYIYQIWNGKFKNPFLSDRAYNSPFYIDGKAVKQMNDSAENFIGTHDFSAFMSQGSKISDTIRTVFNSAVYNEGDDMIIFKVVANGFLYNMVRIMAGTLLEVAGNKIQPEEIEKIILSKNRKNAGFTAPAHGLYLNLVSYEEYGK